jgi:hypothetical protein
MLTYKAPLRDIKFLINDVFDFQTHYKDLDNGENADPETVDMILQGFADFAENVLAPLYQPADAEGCHFENGVVTTPKGFKEAYDQFVEGGWHGRCILVYQRVVSILYYSMVRTSKKRLTYLNWSKALGPVPCV